MPDTSSHNHQRYDDQRSDDQRFGDRRARKVTPTVITNAHSGTSREMASREKRYAITMAIRTACFVSMIFVTGPMRWVLLAGAVFLPYIAVVLANQANTKTSATPSVPAAVPTQAPALTTGPAAPEIIEGELLSPDLVEDSALQHHHVPHDYVPHDYAPHDYAPHDRVA